VATPSAIGGSLMARNPDLDVYFGDGLLDAGFTPVPNLLIRFYRKLSISEEQLAFIIHLMGQRYDKYHAAEDLPDIARRMDKNLATVRGYSRQLRRSGLITVTPRYHKGAQIGNVYNLAPLWDTLRGFAPPSPPPADPDITLGPTLPGPVAQRVPESEQMFKRRTKTHGGYPSKNTRPALLKMPALPHAETPALPHADLTGLKRKEEVNNDQEAAAAATIFRQIISSSDAAHLITQYPACIAHPEQLIEQATRPKVRDQAAMLVHLIKTGWTPPTGLALAGSDDDPFRYMRAADGRCTICGGELDICKGQHLPPWMQGGTDEAAS